MALVEIESGEYARPNPLHLRFCYRFSTFDPSFWILTLSILLSFSVVKLMLQFLKENNLINSFEALQARYFTIAFLILYYL
jgi:hypothetical protein